MISVNDFGGGDVLFVAGLDTLAGATSYNLYVDGELWGTVTNGANLEITNFPSGAHAFCVTGVNAEGEFEKSRDITVTIPTHETTKADETSEVTTSDNETTEVTTTGDETTEEQTPETTTEVQVTGPEYTYAAGSAALMEASYLGGDVGANQYKAICGQGYVNGIVNIQKLPDAADYGIYVNFPDADFGEMTVNGKTLNCYQDGAGIIMYLPNFEYMYNPVFDS